MSKTIQIYGITDQELHLQIGYAMIRAEYEERLSIIRQRVSMSNIDQSQANILHDYLNDRADRLDRNNALLVRSEIEDDN